MLYDVLRPPRVLGPRDACAALLVEPTRSSGGSATRSSAPRLHPGDRVLWHASSAAPWSKFRVVRPPLPAACQSRLGPLLPRPGCVGRPPGRAPRRLWPLQAGLRHRRTSGPRQYVSLSVPSWPPPPGQRALGAVVSPGRRERVLWVGLAERLAIISSFNSVVQLSRRVARSY